jgi:coatomer subunit gamma
MARKGEDDRDISIFANLDKSTVFQESRAFNESPLNPRKCRIILAKINVLLGRKVAVSAQEATEIFFSITKLFQCPDVDALNLRYSGRNDR